MTTKSIVSRLARIEQRSGAGAEEGQRALFFCEGPVHMSGHEFLQGLGYVLPRNAMVIKFTGAADGRCIDLPAKDLTPRFAPENAVSECLAK